MTQLEAWDWLRQTRAHPPGAAHEGEAADLYRAAIQQAEDLMLAAASTGRAARPLPLFYALSQAGKAIEACYGAAESRSHGLHLVAVPQSILEARIQSDSGGRFGSVAKCVGSPALPDEVELGALIASLPALSHLLPGGSPWLRPVCMHADEEIAWTRVGKHPVRVELDPIPVDEAGVRKALEPYPQVGDRLLIGKMLRPEDVPLGWTVGGHWDLTANGNEDYSGGIQHISTFLPGCVPGEPYWLRPSVAPALDLLPPDGLMTRWLIVYALSMIARYHPREWVRSLDPDGSDIAVLLDRCMSDAIELMPELIGDAVERVST